MLVLFLLDASSCCLVSYFLCADKLQGRLFDQTRLPSQGKIPRYSCELPLLHDLLQNWKKRWFVLYRNELKYFASPGDKEPLRAINLEDVTGIDRDDTAGKCNCFRYYTLLSYDHST